jgi:DNA-binding PadR family transcriptional regulator
MATVIKLNDCDKMVRRALYAHGCQTSQQLRTYSNREYDEDHSTGSISAALRKLTERGLAAYSLNERNQKVYWLTDFGSDIVAAAFVKGEL